METDRRLQAVAKSHERLAESERRLAEAQAATEEKLHALIAVVDGIVRKPPPEQKG